MISLSRARKVALAAITGAAFAVVPALTTSAHVTVSSSDAMPGGSGTLVFRVPTESDTADTTALTIELPADTPFRSVRAATMPGWVTSFERTELDEPVEIDGFTLTEVVTSVTWTAEARGVAPDEFAEFQLRVGPFPDAEATYEFPATQTYSDGEVVAWADQAAAGGEEPQHPAPTLRVGADGVAAGDDSHGAANDAGAPESGGSDSTARVLGIVGIAIGGLGFGGGWALGRRRPAVSTP